MGDIAIAQLPWRDEVATLLMAIAIVGTLTLQLGFSITRLGCKISIGSSGNYTSYLAFALSHHSPKKTAPPLVARCKITAPVGVPRIHQQASVDTIE